MPKQPRTAKQMKERRDSLRPHLARSQIIDVMRSYGQPISPTQLSKIIGFSLGSTSYHVRTLVSAGVVTLQEEGRVRGAVEHFYVLASGDANLVDRDEQLLRFASALTVPADDGGYPVPTILDARARKELARARSDRAANPEDRPGRYGAQPSIERPYGRALRLCERKDAVSGALSPVRVLIVRAS